MDQLPNIDQALEKAFGLAYFIQGDEESAKRIVVGAMNKLQVATTAQNQRLRYNPHGRSSPDRSTSSALRSKVSFSDIHLLQRLIYVESEPFEIQKEQGGGVTSLRNDDLLVHFIKHLVRMGIKRNSFYVTLGMSRLLYNYSTAETMEIYNLVVQDPSRVKDDFYYRSRKGVLLNELKDRFGNLVGTQRGPRGELRLETENSSDRHAELVRRCLARFVPWSTKCFLPQKLDPMSEEIPQLKNEGRYAEDAVEINRIHAVLHPGCWQRLISALGLHSPSDRLAVPRFFLAENGGDPNPPRRQIHEPQFDQEILKSIKNALAEQANRRRRSAPTVLRVLVDGTEHARLNLKRARHTRFPLREAPELIEVRGCDEAGELLLAAHLITTEQVSSEPVQTSIITEANQRISINVFLAQDVGGEVAGGQVEVKYEERGIGALARLASRVEDWFGGGIVYHGWLPAFGLKPVAFLMVGAAVLAAIVWFSWSRLSRDEAPTVIADQQTTPSSPVKEEPKPSPAQVTQRNSTSPTTPAAANARGPSTADKSTNPPPLSTPKPEQERIVRHPSDPSTSASDTEPTRGPTDDPVVSSLGEVVKIHLQLIGVEPVISEVRRTISEGLRSDQRLSIIESPNEADAVLRIIVSGSRRVSIRAQLINPSAQVLWPAGRRSRVVEGEAATAAATMARTLLDDIQRSRKR